MIRFFSAENSLNPFFLYFTVILIIFWIYGTRNIVCSFQYRNDLLNIKYSLFTRSVYMRQVHGYAHVFARYFSKSQRKRELIMFKSRKYRVP